MSPTGGHSGPPLRGEFGICGASDIRDNHAITRGRTRRSAPTSRCIDKPSSATRGGMLSGRAASRTGQLSDTASQHPFGGWQGGCHPRWQYPRPQSEMITPTIGDGRPTWPPDVTAKPSQTERSTGFRVTSGDLGTHAMHPPRKRESIGTNAMHPPGTRIIDINKRLKRIHTRGWTYVIHPSTWQA